MYDVRNTIAYAICEFCISRREAAVQCICGGATFRWPQNRGSVERSWAMYGDVLYLKIKIKEKQIKFSI